MGAWQTKRPKVTTQGGLQTSQPKAGHGGQSCPRPVSFLTKVSHDLSSACRLSFCIYDTPALECQSDPFSRPLGHHLPAEHRPRTLSVLSCGPAVQSPPTKQNHL